MREYLFIGAHTDDIDLSCGGTIAKLIEQGKKVQMVPMSNCGRQDLSDEAWEASKILGAEIWINEFTVKLFHEERQIMADYFAGMYKYQYVFTHSTKCRHPDHRTVAEESKRIFTGNFFTFIQPWNGRDDENYFVELSEKQLEKKIQALACYKSQAHRPYMDPEFIRSWARYDGIKCGKKYAEGFRIERLIQ